MKNVDLGSHSLFLDFIRSNLFLLIKTDQTIFMNKSYLFIGDRVSYIGIYQMTNRVYVRESR